jgi:hypothetical protein
LDVLGIPEFAGALRRGSSGRALLPEAMSDGASEVPLREILLDSFSAGVCPFARWGG